MARTVVGKENMVLGAQNDVRLVVRAQMHNGHKDLGVPRTSSTSCVELRPVCV